MYFGAVTAQESRPKTGAREVVLNVEVSSNGKNDSLAKGIRSLYENAALCDVSLVAGGESFSAHKAALATYPALRDRLHKAVTEAAASEAVAKAAKANEAATSAETAPAEVTAAPKTETVSGEAPAAEPPTAAPSQSPALADNLAATTAPEAAAAVAPADGQNEGSLPSVQPSAAPMLEMHFPDISSPEAIRIMLAHIYGVDSGEVANYAPSSDEVNKDILRLASQLQLPSLKEFATHWMASGLNSTNAVPRLSTCQEFALRDLFDAGVEALAGDAFALGQVSENFDIIKHPRLLQKLLIRFAALYPKGGKRERTAEAPEEQRPSKRSRAIPQEGGA